MRTDDRSSSRLKVRPLASESRVGRNWEGEGEGRDNAKTRPSRWLSGRSEREPTEGDKRTGDAAPPTRRQVLSCSVLIWPHKYEIDPCFAIYPDLSSLVVAPLTGRPCPAAGPSSAAEAPRYEQVWTESQLRETHSMIQNERGERLTLRTAIGGVTGRESARLVSFNIERARDK